MWQRCSRGSRVPVAFVAVTMAVGSGLLLVTPNAAKAQSTSNTVAIAQEATPIPAERRFRISLGTYGLGISYDLVPDTGKGRPIVSVYGESIILLNGLGLGVRSSGDRYGGIAVGVYSIVDANFSFFGPADDTSSWDTVLGARVFAGFQNRRGRFFGEIGIGYVSAASDTDAFPYPHLAFGLRF